MKIARGSQSLSRESHSRYRRIDPRSLALIAANGGKMLAKEARAKMHLSKSRFSELLSKMDEYVEKRPFHLDRTQNIIILK
jgi:hypothetical protein